MEVTISASVSDVTDAVLMAMRQKVASEVGVALAAVSATVTAASALIAFTVNFQTEASADAALTTLSTALSDPAAASEFFTTAALAITVETINTPPTKQLAAPPPPPLSPSSSAGFGAVVAGVGGGAASVLLLLAGCLIFVWRSRSRSKQFLRYKHRAVISQQVEHTAVVSQVA